MPINAPNVILKINEVINKFIKCDISTTTLICLCIYLPLFIYLLSHLICIDVFFFLKKKGYLFPQTFVIPVTAFNFSVLISASLYNWGRRHSKPVKAQKGGTVLLGGNNFIHNKKMNSNQSQIKWESKSVVEFKTKVKKITAANWNRKFFYITII